MKPSGAKNTLREGDLQMQQAVAFVETLCDEMTEIQIANALERWKLICEEQGWSRPAEIEMPG
jgi:hypothetical protein